MKRSSFALTASAGLLATAVLVFIAKNGFTPNWPDTLAGVREDFPDVRQISTAELASWLHDTGCPPPLVLDVREPAEFEVGHLPGARCISPNSDPAAVLEDISPNRAIVVYCSVGYRSSRYATRLADAGFSNVVNLEGSIFKWANEGRPLENASGGTNVKVHPFDSRWGQLLKPSVRSSAED